MKFKKGKYDTETGGGGIKRKYDPEGMQVYQGQNCFKARLLLSLLSKNPFRVTQFRIGRGIKGFETSLLEMIEKVTDGTKYSISPNGQEIEFYPGSLLGGEMVHNCDLERSIGYYLELLLPIAFFSKEPTSAKLTGITNDRHSTSVDYIKRNTMAWLKEVYKIDEGFDLKVTKRGMVPNGGGEVIFNCPIMKEFPAVQVMDEGKIKRIRGVTYSCKVPATNGSRMVEAAKGYFLNYLNDIYIYTDQNTGKLSGNSPGFGIYLEAETTMGVIYSAEVISEAGEGNPEPAEDLAERCCNLLMDKIYFGGCVDADNQWLMILLMALSASDVSKVILGKLTDGSINFLRLMYDFLKIKFKIDWHKPADVDDESDDTDSDEENEQEDTGKTHDLPFSIRPGRNKDDTHTEVEETSKSSAKTDENTRVLLACAGLGYKNLHRKLL